MLAVRKVAGALSNHYNVRRCALVTEGDNTTSILPLHGLSEEWKPITSDTKEYNEVFPGYISSKDGPPMESSELQRICSEIQAVSGISEPFNYDFDGDESDNNLFARLVRGEIPQSRVWESKDHIAFLTPFGNAPGFTVLVPRHHLGSDILSLDEASYVELLTAAHKVANILKRSFGIEHCGMIFEGFEIDYAHVKLIPIHTALRARPGETMQDQPRQQAEYVETYQGFVTSLYGPPAPNMEQLTRIAAEIRKSVHGESVKPPNTWKEPLRHISDVLREPWYSNLFSVQDALVHTSVDFFKGLGYKYCLVPSTTDSISSPLDAGSDSEPVSISFLGQKTFLADSMQFALEYFLRIDPSTTDGTYYVSTSFRGEDPDAMHLNQFYQIECELRGPFAQGIVVAERYITNLVGQLLRDHETVIRASAGTTDHLCQLLSTYKEIGFKFPQITLDSALNLPEMSSTEYWKYVIPSDPSKGRTITRAGERKLIDHFGGAVWLTEMDHASVPFYQAFSDKAMFKARCTDLLLGPGEVLGLGERHTTADDARMALDRHRVSTRRYEWYINMRKEKPMTTTGWGMGVERFLAWCFQHHDVRDLTIVPRMKGMVFNP